MFIKNYNANPVEDTKTVQLSCLNCNNTTEHQVYEAYYGPQIGLIFLKKPLLGMKKYFLICPICNFPAKEITTEQMKSLKK